MAIDRGRSCRVEFRDAIDSGLKHELDELLASPCTVADEFRDAIDSGLKLMQVVASAADQR